MLSFLRRRSSVDPLICAELRASIGCLVDLKVLGQEFRTDGILVEYEPKTGRVLLRKDPKNVFGDYTECLNATRIIIVKRFIKDRYTKDS